MVSLFGLILIALGVALIVGWWSPAFVAALQVLVAVSLLFWGLLGLLMGVSEFKAKREFEAASIDLHEELDEPSEASSQRGKKSKTTAGAA